MSLKQSNTSATSVKGSGETSTTTARKGPETEQDPVRERGKVNKLVKEIAGLFGQLTKHTTEFSDYENIVLERNDLKKRLEQKDIELKTKLAEKDKELATKDAELKLLKLTKGSQLDEFMAKYDEWKDKEAALQKKAKADIEAAKEDHKETMRATTEELEICQSDLAHFQVNLVAANRHMDTLNNQLTEYGGQLQYWNGFVQQFRTLDTVAT
jgi:chromosome segregation ATPase